MMTSKSGWCMWFRMTLHTYGPYEERYRELAELSKSLLDELEKNTTHAKRLEGAIFALALLVEQHISVHDDDPALVGVMQQLFYELPNYIPELNRSFFELEIYPLLSIMTIYE